MIAQSEQTDLLFAALVRAQSRIRDAGKDRANPQLRNRYATLESVLWAIREPFADAGLAVVQVPGEVVDGLVTLTTQVIHESGQFLRATSSCPLVGYKGSGADENKGINAAQAFGVVVTYLRRYALMAAAGIVGTDDDTDGDVSGQRPGDARRGDDREEQRPQERQERPAEPRRVDASRTGGQTVDFGAIADRFAALTPPWTKEDVAAALGIRDFFHANVDALRGLYAAAQAGTAQPGGKATTPNQGGASARREAP